MKHRATCTPSTLRSHMIVSSSNRTPLGSIINFIKKLIFFNFQCAGLQPNSDPPTWVIGSNLHVHLVEGVATRLQESLSPYAVLGSELAPLPTINIKGNLHVIKSNAYIMLTEPYRVCTFSSMLLITPVQSKLPPWHYTLTPIKPPFSVMFLSLWQKLS